MTPRLPKTTMRLKLSATIALLFPWQAVACDCGTVYFLVSHYRADLRPSSYVLPLSDEQDKQHARALIEWLKKLKNTPGEPISPPEPGTIVLAEVAWGADGINRNHLVPGKPEWPWHVAKFHGRSEEHTSELQSPCNLV